MKILFSYNKKWLIYVVSFFLLFTGILLVSEYRHEKIFRTEALNEELDNYTVLINSYIGRHDMLNTGNYSGLDSLNSLISKKSLRITVIGLNGRVLYDSQVKDVTGMENHLMRPEVQASLQSGRGSNIRLSKTTGIKYYYYARRYSQFFVRVSVVYDFTARKFIQPDRIFILFVLLIFFFTSFTIILITDKFSKSIRTLREFTMKALADEPIDVDLEFPGNELGVIGKDIIAIYHRLNKTKEELIAEKAKLIRHLNLLDEGIAIFSREKKVITANNQFITSLNHISDMRVFTADDFFRIEDFSSLAKFIGKYINDEKTDLNRFQPTYEINLNRGGKYFLVKSVVFQDRSFEVSIQDVTRPAKRKLLKQQMTDNIAHELKTPVSSIKGFLETVLEGNPGKEKTTDFLQRAYAQSCRLANLINDISLLTKIEEASNLYQKELVNLHDLILDVASELEPQCRGNHVALELKVAESLTLNGNPVLLYSVFRNLFDNALSHGGGNLTITVENYLEDKDFCYFSFSDTGIGVPEEDLPRLFERFYRVDKGRDRKSGGTGLGLAIVKNAVQFHKGDISVKNRNGGGLEFLFTLAKEVTSDE
jgi:two-component system, OmpR family, phosphate regulon sensor histidine kinase PhoR